MTQSLNIYKTLAVILSGISPLRLSKDANYKTAKGTSLKPSSAMCVVHRRSWLNTPKPNWFGT
jgi:hypothetical protein